MKQSAWTSLVAVAAWGAVVGHASLWDNVFQGLDYVATPSGQPLSTLADGTRINGARAGRLRIVPNGVLGQGYRLEFDRTFGNDSRGRPETFRFGSDAEMTLVGATQFTAGYNSGLAHTMGGFADLAVSDLSYDLKTKNGAQDVELSGTLNVIGDMDINTLGFYDLTFNASNTDSSLKIDGVAVRDNQTTNFDVGPIRIKGNIFWDLGLAALDAIGVDTSGLQNVFPSSPIDQINEALSGQLFSGDTTSGDLASLLMQTVLGQDEKAATALTAGLADGSLRGDEGAATPTPSTVPEPGTLLLVAAGSTVLWCRRRK